VVEVRLAYLEARTGAERIVRAGPRSIGLAIWGHVARRSVSAQILSHLWAAESRADPAVLGVAGPDEVQ
jgi:hypothetical protein